jgi:hypothetical protein
MNQLMPLRSPALLAPVLVAPGDDKASIRSLGFFAANIRNANTRRAYSRAARGMAVCPRRLARLAGDLRARTRNG